MRPDVPSQYTDMAKVAVAAMLGRSRRRMDPGTNTPRDARMACSACISTVPRTPAHVKFHMTMPIQGHVYRLWRIFLSSGSSVAQSWRRSSRHAVTLCSKTIAGKGGRS